MTLIYITSSRVLVVVPNTDNKRRSTSRSPGRRTLTPIMQPKLLRNFPVSAWEAVDRSQEQAELGKQNKHMIKEPKLLKRFV